MRIGKENLVAQLKLHNGKALEYLVAEHGERLISIIRKHLFTLPHLQQDCLIATVQAIWDYAECFQQENEFENWIGSVARYCCLEFLQAYRQEATIAWLIEKEITEEKEMMASCLEQRDQELFYQFCEGKAPFAGASDPKELDCSIYQLLNRIDTDIFEYEKEPLSQEGKQAVLAGIQIRKKERKWKFSIKKYLRLTELPAQKEKTSPYFPQKSI